MKRTVFFVSSLGDGGAQRVISILSEKMALEGMDVEIVTYLDVPIVYHVCPKVTVTCVEKCTGTKSIVSNLLWLRRYFKTHAEIILSFLAPFNMIALVATMGTKIPIVVAYVDGLPIPNVSISLINLLSVYLAGGLVVCLV